MQSQESNETVATEGLRASVTFHLKSGEKRRLMLDWRRRTTLSQEISDELLFTAPVGLVVARLTRNTDGVVLDWQGKQIRAERASQLMQDQLGYTLPPLDAFWYWMQGLSIPVFSSREYTLPGGDIIEIEQQGWQIQYDNRDENGLPERLQLRAPSGERVNVAIKQWW